jgi:hypothetical protein
MEKITKEKIRWAEKTRYKYLEKKLLWEGFVSNTDICNEFDVKQSNASHTIADFAEISGMCEKDRGLVLCDENAFEFLTENEAISPPNSDKIITIQPYKRNEPLLHRISRAIHSHQPIKIEYVSRSENAKSNRKIHRTVSPHALVHDTLRWHFRGWDHDQKKYCDFVVARTVDVEELEDEYFYTNETDKAWHTYKKATIVPNPSLPTSLKKSIAMEYGMEANKITITERSAILFYYLLHLGFHWQASKSEINAYSLDPLQSLKLKSIEPVKTETKAKNKKAT